MISICCGCECNRLDATVNFECNWCLLDYTLNTSIHHQKKEAKNLLWLTYLKDEVQGRAMDNK